jgi:hypothetical protein
MRCAATSAAPPQWSPRIELDEDSYRDIVEVGGFAETWYSRFGNPTVSWAADAVARLEGGQAAVMTSSGMGAIATTLLSLCQAGDRIVAGRELYGDTRDLLVRDLPALGIRVDFIRTADLAQWEAALAAAPAAVAYAESLSNPQLRVLDVPRVAELAHRAVRAWWSTTRFPPLQPSAARAGRRHRGPLGHQVPQRSLRRHRRRRGRRHRERPRDLAAGRHGWDLPRPTRRISRRRALHTYELRLGRQASGRRKDRSLAGGVARGRPGDLPRAASHPDTAVAERTWRPGRRRAMVAFVVRAVRSPHPGSWRLFNVGANRTSAET